MTWLAALYPWTKALHIVAVIAWMAALLYLPRLFVYHAEAAGDAAAEARFVVMERRLHRAIMSPAMIATYLFGAMVAATPGIVDWGAGWIWAKLVLVALLTGAHHAFGRWRRELAAGTSRHGTRFFRIANEVPTLLMIAIVVMVVVRPF